jgi:hypothetical protein
MLLLRKSIQKGEWNDPWCQQTEYDPLSLLSPQPYLSSLAYLHTDATHVKLVFREIPSSTSEILRNFRQSYKIILRNDNRWTIRRGIPMLAPAAKHKNIRESNQIKCTSSYNVNKVHKT